MNVACKQAEKNIGNLDRVLEELGLQ